MTEQAWETLSNQAIAAAGIVYFLSLLAYLVQWASLRNVPVAAAERVAVGAGGSGPDTPDGPAEVGQSRRAELTGRLGLLLAGLGCALQFVSLLGRGMAADPNRVPWGSSGKEPISRRRRFSRLLRLSTLPAMSVTTPDRSRNLPLSSISAGRSDPRVPTRVSFMNSS